MNCPMFIAKGFALRTAAHMAHLGTSSYAEHMALDTFYNEIVPLVDKYAEVYMGLEGQIHKFPNVPVSQGPILDQLTDFLDDIVVEAEEDQNSQALTNILAEIEELTAQTIYKLKFLS